MFSVLWTLAITALAGVPMTAAIVYSVLRSRESPSERRSRELYRILLEEEIHGEQCFACRGRVESDWLRCPTCTAALRGRCRSCEAIVRLHWSACPWCTAELGTLERDPEPAHHVVRAAAA
jgi:hypothetical protein